MKQEIHDKASELARRLMRKPNDNKDLELSADTDEDTT